MQRDPHQRPQSPVLTMPPALSLVTSTGGDHASSDLTSAAAIAVADVVGLAGADDTDRTARRDDATRSDPASSLLPMSADPRVRKLWQGYPGSKAASGVIHKIIGQMPPHRTYVEAFVGFGAVMRAKRPAEHSIAIDADSYIAHRWRELKIPTLEVIHGDALRALTSHPTMQAADTLVYIDAPYLREVRTRLLYAHEFETIEQHKSLLTMLASLPCMVMVSHYPCSLYSTMLETWRSITFPAMTRGGVRTEQLWMNFPEPKTFHDPRWCGEGFREREYVKRKRIRWVKRLKAMKAFERQIIREALDDVES